MITKQVLKIITKYVKEMLADIDTDEDLGKASKKYDNVSVSGNKATIKFVADDYEGYSLANYMYDADLGSEYPELVNVFGGSGTDYDQLKKYADSVTNSKLSNYEDVSLDTYVFTIGDENKEVNA